VWYIKQHVLHHHIAYKPCISAKYVNEKNVYLGSQNHRQCIQNYRCSWSCQVDWYRWQIDCILRCLQRIHQHLCINYTSKCFSKKNIPPCGPCWRVQLGHPWGYPLQNRRKPVLCSRTVMQNFTLIGKAPAEKSVTVQNEWIKTSKLTIPLYTTYGGIKCWASVC